MCLLTQTFDQARILASSTKVKKRFENDFQIHFLQAVLSLSAKESGGKACMS